MNPQPWKEDDCGLQALWLNDAYLGCATDIDGYYIDEEAALDYDCAYIAEYIYDSFDFEGAWATGCIDLNDDGTCAEYECVVGEWTEVVDGEYYSEWTYTCTYTTATLPTEPNAENDWYGCGLSQYQLDGTIACVCYDVYGLNSPAVDCYDPRGDDGFGCTLSMDNDYFKEDGETFNPRYQNYYCEPSCELELNDDGSCPDADCAYIYESYIPGVYYCACESGPANVLNGVLEDDGSCTTSCDTVYQFYGDANYWTCMDPFVYGGY